MTKTIPLNNILPFGLILEEIKQENAELEAENAQLKKWCEEFNALEVAKENTKLKTENKWYSEQLNEAVKEISQLKELLKECREILDYAKDFAYHDPCSKCITKIDQVLGEE